MKRESLQAFNDGVIAIIITLMMLEIKLPGESGHDYWFLLQHIGIYAISFAIAAILWLNIHSILDSIDCLDHKAIWLNLVLLFFLSLMPLPTQAIGEDLHARAGYLFFGSVMSMVALVYAAFHHAVEEDMTCIPPEAKRSLRLKNYVAVTLFTISIPLTFVSVWVALFIFILVPALYFLPSRHLIAAAEAKGGGNEIGKSCAICRMDRSHHRADSPNPQYFPTA